MTKLKVNNEKWASACFFECDVADVDIDMLNFYMDIKPFIKESK